MSSMRLVLAIVTTYDLEVDQIDVVLAFLHHKGIENDNTNGLLLNHVLNLYSINNSANRVIHACA